MRAHILAILTCTGLGACAGTSTYGTYDYGYGYTTPELAYVSPGVQVLADWHEPIFYSNNLYWRYDRGYWYRSPYYNRGWVYASPPRALLRIDRPYAYTRYRPYGYTSRYRDNRYYRDSRYYRTPVYRDDRRYRDNRYYRTPSGGYYRDNRYYRTPTQRDNRYYRTPTQRDYRQYRAPTQRDTRYDGTPAQRDYRQSRPGYQYNRQYNRQYNQPVQRSYNPGARSTTPVQRTSPVTQPRPSPAQRVPHSHSR